MSENTNNLNDNGVIPNFTPAPVFRNSVENKNLLSKKNSMYIGTGETQTIKFGGIKYSIPITKALDPPTVDKSVLKTDSDGENVLWGPLKVSEIEDDGTSVNVVSVESIQQALGLSLSQLDLLVQLSKLITVSSEGEKVVVNGSVAANNIKSLDEIVTYTLNNGEATITGLTEKGRKLFSEQEQQGELPTFINGIYPVTAIADGAFKGESSITYMSISSSIASIGRGIFDGCIELNSLIVNSENTTFYAVNNCIVETSTKVMIAGCKSSVIPSDGSVTSIGDSAFSGCSGLTSITIPGSVTSIGDSAFSGCSGLTSIYWNATSTNDFAYDEGVFYNAGVTEEGMAVVFGNNVQKIPAYLFYVSSSSYRPNIKSVTIGNSVKSIGSGAFYGCSGLTSITIPNSVTSIGNSAFYGCAALTAVSFGSSVRTIGDYAFGDCSSLASINIPNSMTSIGDYAFSRCSGLTSVTLGSNVTSIGGAAFLGCSGLTSIVIPNSVQDLGDYVLSQCSSLTSVRMGDNITNIGTRVFFDCTSLSSITLPANLTTIGPEAFAYCSSLISIVIPNKVTEINEMAFYFCSSLSSITIGSAVSSIEPWAFGNCSSLNSATFVDTTTWYVSKSSDFSNKIPLIQLSAPYYEDKEIWAANALRNTYVGYYWRKE